jgi:NADH-quinone oxidoreductase subunit B
VGLIDGKIGPNFITTTADFFIDWAMKNSMYPMLFGTACCAIEMMASGISRYDVFERFGMLFRMSPRQADVLIVSGTVTKKMAPVMKTIYEQMPDPKWVIAMGGCASTGGPFRTYSTVQGIDEIIPVDIYMPGCPPTPEAFAYGVLQLQEKIGQRTIARVPKEKAVAGGNGSKKPEKLEGLAS